MKDTPFKYSTVVITGGSSGIGSSFIASIINIEQKVLVCNLSRKKPEIFLGNEHLYHCSCDLSKEREIEKSVEEIEEVIEKRQPEGEILLINNSGYGSYGGFQDCELSNQLGVIDVNIRAVVELTGRMLPMLMKRGGGIINIASTAGFQPTPYLATYGATKAFVLNWTLALGEDLRGTGVQVLAVCPGPTETEFFKRAGFDEESSHRQSAEGVVRESLEALDKGKKYVVTGWRNKIMTCITSKLPLSWVTWLAGVILRRVRKNK